MKIQFIGATRSVTGSMHMLQTKKAKVLMDCGLVQGHRQESFQLNLRQAEIGAVADTLILSHAHIDHSGNIPTLVKSGFSGNIWTTAATRDLCSAMLRDSAHLQESDVDYLNKRRRKRGEPLLEPLYTRQDADKCMAQFVGIDYHRSFMVAPGVKVTFYDAGHILGSALVVLDIEEEGRKVRLGFTGDLGRNGLPILRDPEVMSDLNYLVMESTYGSRSNEAPEDARQHLREIINDTYKRGGKVIIPAFAVGRTQEVIYDLYVLRQEREIPEIPIYVDSPLAVDATEIFRLHPECYDEDMERLLQESRFGPLGASYVTYVRHVEDSKELNFLRQPVIIVSASGMVEGGRILHHLKNNIEDERNTVLFVGYQAEHTLGRRIQDGAQEISIFDEIYKVQARVESITGYSAHADREGLVAYAESVAKNGDLRGIFLVHGEDEATLYLSQALREALTIRVTVPGAMETVSL